MTDKSPDRTLPQTLRRDLPRALLWQRLRYRLLQPLYASGPYRWTLGPSRGGTEPATPPFAWPGDPALGQKIVARQFTFAGRLLVDPRPLWRPLGADSEWRMEANAFQWLVHLQALGGDQARRVARDLIADWLATEDRFQPLSWHPAVLGRRIASWLGHYEFFAASAEADLRQRLLASVRRQARHLYRVLPAGLSGLDLMVAIKGLLLAGLALEGSETFVDRGLALLARHLPQQVLPDGGQIERSPSRQLHLLTDLLDLRAALGQADRPLPIALVDAIEQLTPLIKMLQHGDGGLALFNGGRSESATLIEAALVRAGGRQRLMMSAPQSGFYRLQAGRSVVLVDAGAPPPPGADEAAHAGTLSFELSSGRERLVVNCGGALGDPLWREAARTTAAHSTLTLADHNSSQLLPLGGFGRRRALATCRRQEAEGDIWLDMAQEGYQALYGITHKRRLFLERSGEDLRGEDVLIGRRADLSFAIRFHLHPDVQASLAQGGGAALLRTARGEGWRLRCKGAEVSLEPSVYLDGPEPRRTLQVVLTASTQAGETQVLWGLQREARAKK